jgi:hypothetical protein
MVCQNKVLIGAFSKFALVVDERMASWISGSGHNADIFAVGDLFARSGAESLLITTSGEGAEVLDSLDSVNGTFLELDESSGHDRRVALIIVREIPIRIIGRRSSGGRGGFRAGSILVDREESCSS